MPSSGYNDFPFRQSTHSWHMRWNRINQSMPFPGHDWRESNASIHGESLLTWCWGMCATVPHVPTIYARCTYLLIHISSMCILYSALSRCTTGFRDVCVCVCRWTISLANVTKGYPRCLRRTTIAHFAFESSESVCVCDVWMGVAWFLAQPK